MPGMSESQVRRYIEGLERQIADEEATRSKLKSEGDYDLAYNYKMIANGLTQARYLFLDVLRHPENSPTQTSCPPS